MQLTLEHINQYQSYLYNQERSQATIEKYIRDIYKFMEYLNDHDLSKEHLIEYKKLLLETYQTSSINSMIISIHGFLDFIGLSDYKVKLLKTQKKLFIEKDKELTKKEYKRLLETAKSEDNQRLYMLLQTICATGIRVSEHKYITIESLKRKKTTINNKGKIREIVYPNSLKKKLIQYCEKNNITKGAIFITKNGKPLDRSNIWKDMKKLCRKAHVDEGKVFPHNLRHLFAFTYYHIEKDLVRLADILGHSSIETTRIYTKTSISSYEKQFEKMYLIDQE